VLVVPSLPVEVGGGRFLRRPAAVGDEGEEASALLATLLFLLLSRANPPFLPSCCWCSRGLIAPLRVLKRGDASKVLFLVVTCEDRVCIARFLGAGNPWLAKEFADFFSSLFVASVVEICPLFLDDRPLFSPSVPLNTPVAAEGDILFALKGRTAAVFVLFLLKSGEEIIGEETRSFLSSFVRKK